MKYSLIIATLGRKKELLELIESIKNSDYETNNLEIIIVDQNEKGFLDKELSKFENLNIKFKVDVTNVKERPFIKLNGNLYELVRRNGQELIYLAKNELVKNHSYNAVYRENKFVVESASLLAQEEAFGLINIKTIKNLVKTEVPDATETTKGISSYSNIIDLFVKLIESNKQDLMSVSELEIYIN